MCIIYCRGESVIQLKESYLKYSIVLFALSILLSFLFVIINIDVDVGLSNEIFTFMFFFVFLSLILLCNKKIPISISLIILAGFLIKAIYSYYLHRTIVSPFPDSFTYLSNLEQIKMSDLSIDSVLSISGTLQFGYNYFMYFIVLVFKTNYSLYLANIALFSLTCLMFYKIINSDFSQKIALVSTIMFLCSSNMFLFTSNILKDSLVVFLMMLSLYLYKLSKYKVLSIIPILLLFIVRIYAGGSIALAIVFDMLLLGKYSLRKKTLGIGIMAITTFIVIRGFSLSSYYLTIISIFFSGSGLFQLISSTVMGMFKFYFAPLPWNLISNPDEYLITITDSFLALIFSFTLVLFVLKLLRYKELRRLMWIYLIPIIVHGVALGIQYGGDSARQRIGIYGFVILTFVVGLFYKNKKLSNTQSKQTVG